MSMAQFAPWDTAEFLNTPGRIGAYIEGVIEDGNPAEIREAVGVVARALGMADIASDAGLLRDTLYKALHSSEDDGFDALAQALRAVGARLGHAAQAEADAA